MRTRTSLEVLVASLLVCTAAAWADDGEEHLLAGATAYRAGRYDEALVEFNVALKLGASREARWYVAATLARLSRHEAALEAFLAAQSEASELTDAVLEYHAAMTCFELQLLLCADAHLERAAGQAGPQLKARARTVREAIARALAAPPPPSSIDALLQRATRAAGTGRGSLAFAYYREAEGLARRRPDGHRLAEAKSGLARHQPSPPTGAPK